MRISERGQITIPKHLRERFGLNHDVEVEITATDAGLLIHKRIESKHPVDQIYGILPTQMDSPPMNTWKKSGAMITAVDTSVLLDVFLWDQRYGPESRERLRHPPPLFPQFLGQGHYPP
jgi:AbrB family looped-hinge helix DNA binding protein